MKKKLQELQRRLAQAAGATALALLGATMSPSAMAFTTPAAGSFGYDAYDIFFNKVLGGPIGWVGAGMLLAFGISQIMKQWLVTLLCVIGATLIIKLSTIMTSVGFTF